MKKITAAQKTRHSTTTDQRMASFVFHEGRLVMAPSLSNEIRLNIYCELPSPAHASSRSLTATGHGIQANCGRQRSCDSAFWRTKRAIPESWRQRIPYLRSCEFSAKRGNFAKAGMQNLPRPHEPGGFSCSRQRHLLPVVVQ